MSRTPTNSLLRRLRVLRRPRHPARVTGTEALLGDAKSRVHPGPHVLYADLIRQLEDPVVSEPAFQVVNLFVGDGVWVGGHGVGVGDGGTLVVGVGGRGRVVV